MNARYPRRYTDSSLGMDNKSKSKNLDCEYVCEKVSKTRRSHKMPSWDDAQAQ